MIELKIKNMVCPRCILAVQSILNEMNIQFINVRLGAVQLKNPLTQATLHLLTAELEKLGFAVLQDKDVQRIEKIKNLLVEVVAGEDIPDAFALTRFITTTMNEEYTTLSHLFSSLEGITIEKYFINLKIEKVKEWLFYGELNLSEASYRLGYSSVQHLSAQFKKTTGMTPSEYKQLRDKPRHPLDKLY
jgi:AraC family transcriptional regulator